ncbi:MAG: hypothetical protein R6X25_07040 [Candidatus Krumholzibacteriia bacterium]
MKSKLMISVVFLLSTCSPLAAREAPAQEAPPLGDYHVYFQVGAMTMQHVTFDTDDAGLQIGVAGYKHVGRNWYLGAEAGVGASLGLFSDESSIGMFELNGKRAFTLGSVFRFDLGAGLSYNKVSYEESSWFGSDNDIEIDDWVLGTQALANLHLELGGFIAGAHVKYMLTQDVDGVQEAEGLDKGWDYSNLTLGVHIGILIR